MTYIPGEANFNGLGVWRFRTETTAPPSSGQIRFNNATIGSATKLFIHDVTRDGNDMETLLLAMVTDSRKLYIPLEKDSGQYIVATVSGAPINQTNYIEVNITAVTAVDSAHSNNNKVVVTIF